jgi:cell filamentation protein
MAIHFWTAMAGPSWCSIACWHNAPNKSDYLTALTKELEDPHKGHLDGYLKPFIKSAISPDAFAAKIAAAPGLDGEGEDTVLGRTDDPELKARYEAQELKRKQR